MRTHQPPAADERRRFFATNPDDLSVFLFARVDRKPRDKQRRGSLVKTPLCFSDTFASLLPAAETTPSKTATVTNLTPMRRSRLSFVSAVTTKCLRTVTALLLIARSP
jgi:hypothetical protein